MNLIDAVMSFFKRILKLHSKSTQIESDDLDESKGVSTEDTPQNQGGIDTRKSHVRAMITRRENIPGYKKILTMPDGEIPLTGELAKYYIAVLLNERHRTIELIASIDAPFTGPIDTNLMTLKERVKSKGYKSVNISNATSAIIEIILEDGKKNSSEEEEAKETSELQNDYDDLLKESVEQNISDIHIEVRRDSSIVRTRKDGILAQVHEWPVQYARRLASVIYQVIAEEKDITFKDSEPQSAVVDRDLGNQRIRVRLATMPAYPDGFDMVMRILPMGVAGKKKDDLKTLGYNNEQTDLIRVANSKPTGVTVMAGTTGSGKSTSLKCMIEGRIAHYRNSIKVITVEDPPEYEISGSTQVPVVRSRVAEGVNPFAAAIKAAMRSDPDILMVGEVRDGDSAELLVGAVQSGHQAYTTVHAPSAIGIVGRFRSLGVPDDVLGSQDFLSGLVYQTLVPTLCKECSIPYKEYVSQTNNQTDDCKLVYQNLGRVIEDISENDVRFRNNKGCDKCNAGVTGRTVVCEVIIPDHKMFKLFGERRDLEALYYFKDKGGRTVLDHGIDKIKAGIIDPFDAEHKLGRLTSELDAFGESEDTSTEKLTSGEVVDFPSPTTDK